jgi:hypothetical protein
MASNLPSAAQQGCAERSGGAWASEEAEGTASADAARTPRAPAIKKGRTARTRIERFTRVAAVMERFYRIARMEPKRRLAV